MKRFLRLFEYVRSLEEGLAQSSAHEARLRTSLNSVNSVLRQTQEKLHQLNSPEWSLVQGMTNDQAFELGRQQGIREGFATGKTAGRAEGIREGVQKLVSIVGPWRTVWLPNGHTYSRSDENLHIDIVDGSVRVYQKAWDGLYMEPEPLIAEYPQDECVFTADIQIPPVAASR